MNQKIRFILLLVFFGLPFHQLFAIASPTLNSPANASTNFTGLNLDWNAVVGAAFYQLQVDSSPNFNSAHLFNTTKAYINSSSSNTDTQHYLENLFFNRNYYWRVRCYLAGDTSAWVSRSFSTSGVPSLSSPANASIQFTGLTVDWTPHTGVDFYDVQIDTSLQFNSPALVQATKVYINSSDGNSDTYHFVDNLYFNKSYYWRVRCRNAVDSTPWSASFSFTTRNQVTLSSPALNSVQFTGLTLDWTPHTGVDFYDVQLDTSAAFNSPLLRLATKAYINSTDGNSDTYHYFDNLRYQTNYFWRARCRNATDTASWSLVWSFTTRNELSLTSPADSVQSWTGLTFDWLPHSGVSKYEIVWDTSALFNSPIKGQAIKTYINSTDGNSDTYHYAEDLRFGATYYWKVRSMNTADTSDWSLTRVLFTRDFVNLSSPATASSQWTGLTLNWLPHTGVNFYQLEADTSSSFSSPAKRSSVKSYINSTDGNSDTEDFLSNLYFGKEYFWRVRAINAIDTSLWSETRTIITRDYVTHSSPASATSQWTGLTLDWLPHSGVLYYDVQADTSSQFNSPALRAAFKNYINSTDGNADTYHFLDDLYFGSSYYWRVRARNSVDTSAWSTPWLFTTNDFVTLTSPSEGALSQATAGITLNWAPHAGVDSYLLQWDTTNIFTSPLTQTQGKSYINSTDGNTDTQHGTGSLLSNKIYFWRVRAINAIDSSEWTVRSFSTGAVPVVYPATPIALSPDNNAYKLTASNISFAWSFANNASSYEMIVSASSDFKTIAYRLLTIQNNVLVTSLPVGNWFWKVRAIRNNAIYSPWSDTKSFSLCLTSSSFYQITACAPFVWLGKPRNASGIYQDTIPSASACDSLVTIQLTLNQPKFAEVHRMVCKSFVFNGKTLTQSGVYTDTLQTLAGCDSTVSLHLQVQQDTLFSFQAQACGSYLFRNRILNQSGIYRDTIPRVLGCDSIIELNLSIVPAFLINTNQSSCGAYQFGNRLLTQSGIYVDSLKSSQQCDSVIVLALTIKSPIYFNFQQNVCGSYWFKNSLITQSGIYIDTIPLPGSCDSIVTLNLTVRKASFSNYSIKSCGPYQLGNRTFTQSTQVIDTLLNHLFCDSIRTLSIQIITVDTSLTSAGNTLVANANNANYQWIKCGTGPIPGATGKIFTATQSGAYAVIVGQEQCFDTSACYQVQVTGLSPFQANLGFIAYPNPAFGNCWISGPFDAKLSLFSSDAKELGSYTLQANQPLQLELPSGPALYFIRIQTSQGEQLIKLLRN